MFGKDHSTSILQIYLNCFDSSFCSFSISIFTQSSLTTHLEKYSTGGVICSLQ